MSISGGIIRQVPLLLLGAWLGAGCSAEDPKPSGSLSDFVGVWRQTRGSFDGSCLGPLQTNGGFVFRFRSTGGELEFVQLDQADFTRELWTSPLSVESGVAIPTDSAPVVVEVGETDPITLEPATQRTLITFTSDRFELYGDRLHESVAAIREQGTKSCTFSGDSDYQRLDGLPAQQSSGSCLALATSCTSQSNCCDVGDIPGCCSSDTHKCIAGMAACTEPPPTDPEPGICDGCGGAFCSGRCSGCPGC